MIKRTCDLCGREYETKNKNSKFCCRKCKDKSNKVKKVKRKCAYCGKIIYLLPNRVARGNKNYFCTVEHFNLFCKSNEIVRKETYAEIIIRSKIKGTKIVKVDLEDVERLSKHSWCIGMIKDNYFKINANINSKIVSIHRFIMNCPEDMVVDHINGDTLDNRKSNLRICTQQENSLNRHGHIFNTSGYRNVSFHKMTGRWQVSCVKNYKRYYGGLYDTVEEANQKAEELRKQLGIVNGYKNN